MNGKYDEYGAWEEKPKTGLVYFAWAASLIGGQIALATTLFWQGSVRLGSAMLFVAALNAVVFYRGRNYRKSN